MEQADASQMSAQSWVWLVTGCSSGLGRHLVGAILARGDRVIATARRHQDLDYLSDLEGSKERVHRVTLDVTEPYDQVRTKLEKAADHFGSIDVLVNNAGFVLSGVWEETSDEELHRQFETNFFGAIRVTRCVLPYMRSARSGVILFMGSISGWYGVGAGGPYSASKFAIEGAAECLSKETSHLGIRTHVLVLGQFRTDILKQDRKSGILHPTEICDYHGIKNEMDKRHTQTNGKQPGDPRIAAERIVDLARLEDFSEEKKSSLPLRIPLGSDALEIIRLKCHQTLESLGPWEHFAQSTDFTYSVNISSYLR
ncbi:NAD(P)-binding protein [Corynespora cassiicola Philippines]|uniref:NAD(P)-binding protein n=1 Tax=Corynespora cassiicola Philippines TaxID=1448308 RepID=A0A2T2NTB1_CORCC|nr:NAD(P)-binding protein [Corynespora cassiicola Philippines]